MLWHSFTFYGDSDQIYQVDRFYSSSCEVRSLSSKVSVCITQTNTAAPFSMSYIFHRLLGSFLDMFHKLFTSNWLLHNQMNPLTICVFSISQQDLKVKGWPYEYVWPCLAVISGYMANPNSLEIFHWQRSLFVWTYNLKIQNGFSSLFPFHCIAGYSWGMVYEVKWLCNGKDTERLCMPQTHI